VDPQSNKLYFGRSDLIWAERCLICSFLHNILSCVNGLLYFATGIDGAIQFSFALALWRCRRFSVPIQFGVLSLSVHSVICIYSQKHPRLEGSDFVELC
jgi:hypothetical protein